MHVTRRILLGAGAVSLCLCLLGLQARAVEPEFVVYHSWDDAVARVVLDAFTTETGIEARAMRRSSRHIVKIIEAERDAPVASVLMAGPAASYLMLKAAGLLAAYRPESADAIPAAYRDPDDTWTGIYIGVLAFGSVGLDPPPRSFDDLISLSLPKGVTYSNPATSGTAYTFLLALIALRGEAGAFAFLQQLHHRVVEVPTGGATTLRLVELGEADVAVAFAHDVVRIQRRLPTMLLSFPAEGTGWEVGAAGLLAHAPRPEAGKRFLDFLARPATQELFAVKGHMPVYPTHPDAAAPAGMPPLAEVVRVPIDLTQASQRWDARALRWNRQFPRRK